MTDNPVLAAMEAYKRAHPHREAEIEAAFASYDPNAIETPAVEELPQAIPPPEQVQLDLEAGRAARDQAMARADAAVDPLWRQRAWSAITQLIANHEPFTSDDVWNMLGEAPSEPRALGPLIRRAVDQGLIVRAGERQSKLARRHARPIAVWRPT